MSFVSTVVADLKFALAHPATVRKEIIATATTVGADVTLFSTAVHATGWVATAATVITGVCTFLLAFLGQNVPVAEVKAKLAAKKT